MLRKTLIAVITFVLLFSGSAFATNKEQNPSTFEFSNVYQYNINTYEKETNYKSLKVTILDQNSLQLVLDTGTETYLLPDLKYKKYENSKYKTTLITASGQINDKSQLDFRLAYDKKESANGNIIITESKEITKNDGTTETIIINKFIRFANNEVISLKQMIDGIRAGKEKWTKERDGINSPNGNVTIMTDDLPVVKSYKYSKYMYGGVFWNTNNLIQCDCNNLQIKLVPLYGNFYYYTDPYGNQGTIIYDQSMVISTSVQYNSVQNQSGTNAIAYTEPIVDNESSPRYIPIKVAYKGFSVTVNLPYGSHNNKQNGRYARWNLNRQHTDFVDGSGEILDDYSLEGTTRVSGVGRTVEIDTNVNVTLGVMYYFGSIPAQDIILVDSFSLPRITTTVSN